MRKMERRGLLLSILLATASLLFLVDGVASSQDLVWYRGNTHAHTNKSDGNIPPGVAAEWYLSRGYNFLCITDHHILTPTSSVKLPSNPRKDFILIPGEEITDRLHATAMNIQRTVSVQNGPTLSGTIQRYLEETERASGILIVNHPNFDWRLGAKDIRPVAGVRLFELYNCHPLSNNEGDNSHVSTETMWDELLTDGMVIYGVASDDAHSYQIPYSPNLSSPGKGWVMVQAPKFTADAICDSMRQGRFYATIGVLLKSLKMSPSHIFVEIDKAATESELAFGSAFGRPAPEGSAVGERIDFIGTGGKLLVSVAGLSASYTPIGNGYVRARAVVTRVVNGMLTEYCAWTQPVFPH